MDALRLRLRLFLGLMLAVMALGTVGFALIEGMSPIDAFYFSVVTVTTVGYGDIHPVTLTGKILAMVLILSGVGTFMAVVANATEILLNKRERLLRLQKLNMVIGVFFSEVGSDLLAFFNAGDRRLEKTIQEIGAPDKLTVRDLADLRRHLEAHDYRVEVGQIDLTGLRAFLNQKSNVLLRLLENPNLLEHEAVTEMIRAVVHLKEELAHRGDLGRLPESDQAHLAGDISRSYRWLTLQWLSYLLHLKESYPYLFSLAVRMNPFNPDRSPIVK